MPAIPISPSSIIGAMPYTTSGQGIPIRLCNTPAEGAKTIPMQFTFNDATSFLVNFGNNPNPPISQLCSLYVDNTGSGHDVNILFPDTGYQVRIEQGGSRMIPVITGANQGSTQLPSFYVILDSSGEKTSDICNIQALNIFVPEFEAKELTDVLSFGYGALFAAQPTFTQSKFSTYSMSNPSTGIVLFNNMQWYITAIDISGIFISAGAGFVAAISLLDNGTIIFNEQINVVSNTASPNSAQSIISLSGLQIISSGTGPLSISLSGTAGMESWGLSINIAGGILVP